METYHGHVRTPADAIILFEACRIGMLPRVQRRLSEKERQLIQSGSVFVWDEREAGMRRWTDGKSWSASRVSGSFLTYREMEGKRGGTSVPTQQPRAGKTPDSARGSDDDRDGPDDGPDGYRYKPDGLMKQSFSITTSTGQHLHLISYYSRSHPNAANLPQPSNDPNLRSVRPQKGLYPESTVNDQQNLPVVTRGPMTGGNPYAVPPPHPQHHPMAAAYAARSGAATHPQSYATGYPWPPTPLGTPPTVTIHYPAYLSPAQHPTYHALPPPPPQPSGLPPGYERAIHPIESAVHAPPPPHVLQQGPLLVSARSPRVIAEPTPPDYADPRRASPRTQPHPSPHANGIPVPLPATRSPRVIHQAPPPPASASLSIPPPNSTPKLSPPETNGSGTTVPSISAIMNGSQAGPLPSISAAPPPPPGAPSPAGSGSAPGARPADGPRDIPSDKIGFGGEDMRALRQLDRVFTT
ncbi:Putative Camp independent regulatory protein (AFU_orthologue; AFUA_3G09640) [Aspergillus calidoustus]|uniref:Putative Camp independent regulatory protein (AFU_orthologue AFUA_3G09640) n=1 Tax=Aspergillus calidoustus TaxID=454130 RepID=A0A0U5GA46_ASPCI|nr:Putative Camp independent regulatory protein (AFU_orthologue; AFUA_3G09640) [Aspergillus calidoustus]